MTFFKCISGSCLLLLLAFSQLQAAAPKGSLFMIGGGLDSTLTARMVELADVRFDSYVVIIPLASENQDSAAYLARQRFEAADVRVIYSMFIGQTESATPAQLDSLRGARLIYFTGGDQQILVLLARQLGITPVLHEAYQQGTMLAGTSAGAAVMSKQMITGNQLKAPAYETTFSSLRAGNLELGEGFGFLTRTVIDQHFVTRSRYNRLLNVVLEFPGITGVGINEGTAIYVQDGRAEVFGSSQVIVIRNKKSRKPKGDLLSAPNIRLTILWEGDRFFLR